MKGLETFLTILFFIIAAVIHARIKKRQEQETDKWLDPFREQESTEPPPLAQPRRVARSAPSAPPRPATPPPPDLEELLRRVLGGPTALPTPVPRPPPVVHERSVAGQPPAPPPLLEQEEARNVEDEGLPVRLATLDESRLAYDRASRLETNVAERLRAVDETVSTHRPLTEARVSPGEVREALAMLRQPESTRAALIASVVLGPPRALEG